MPLYARHALSHLWHIDPSARTLEVFKNDGGQWIVLNVHEGNDAVRAEPFAEVQLELKRIWGT